MGKDGEGEGRGEREEGGWEEFHANQNTFKPDSPIEFGGRSLEGKASRVSKEELSVHQVGQIRDVTGYTIPLSVKYRIYTHSHCRSDWHSPECTTKARVLLEAVCNIPKSFASASASPV